MHRGHRAFVSNRYMGRELQLAIQALLDRRLGAAQILGARRYQNVHHALDVVVIRLRWIGFMHDGGDVAQQQTLRVTFLAGETAHRNVFQRLDRVEARRGLAVLGGQEVIVVVLVIDPDRRLNVQIRIQSGDNRGYYLLLRQSQPRGFDPVDFDIERRILGFLRNKGLRNSMHASDQALDLEGGGEQRLEAWSANLHVDRRLRAKIQHRVDDAARGEQGRRFR